MHPLIRPRGQEKMCVSQNARTTFEVTLFTAHVTVAHDGICANSDALKATNTRSVSF